MTQLVSPKRPNI